MTSAIAILSAEHVSVQFDVAKGPFKRARVLRAVQDVSFTLRRGEALGIVGESGSGKSTLVRAALRLVIANAGAVTWLGSRVDSQSARALRTSRRDLQIVFQDPIASLDPRLTVREIVAEPLRVHRPDLARTQRESMVSRMIHRVRLPTSALDRYPHEFSGGQCQRIAIARAMILEPALLVCDEAVSALDVAVQAQVLDLIAELRREHGTTVLFVSHNLAVVRSICDRVLVMYLGRVMEEGTCESVLGAPRHPYTQALVAAVPQLDPEVQRARLDVPVIGEPPSPLDPPSGCVFRTRCPRAGDECARVVPPLEALRSQDHAAACLRLDTP